MSKEHKFEDVAWEILNGRRDRRKPRYWPVIGFATALIVLALLAFKWCTA